MVDKATKNYFTFFIFTLTWTFGNIFISYDMYQKTIKTIETIETSDSRLYTAEMSSMYCRKNCNFADSLDSIEKRKIAYSLIIHFILENMYFEGKLSLDPDDPGNYYMDNLYGTMYGVSASFFFSQYKVVNVDSFYRIQIHEMAKLLANYIEHDYIQNYSLDFIFYYVLFTFYFGVENVHFYMSIYYGKEPNKINAMEIYKNRFMGQKESEYIQQMFENRLIQACKRSPKYAKGWLRKYIELHQRNKHLLQTKPSDYIIQYYNFIKNN